MLPAHQLSWGGHSPPPLRIHLQPWPRSGAAMPLYPLHWSILTIPGSQLRNGEFCPVWATFAVLASPFPLTPWIDATAPPNASPIPYRPPPVATRHGLSPLSGCGCFCPTPGTEAPLAPSNFARYVPYFRFCILYTTYSFTDLRLPVPPVLASPDQLPLAPPPPFPICSPGLPMFPYARCAWI